MTTFYRSGRHSWAGFCEVPTHGKSYIHHPRWPERSTMDYKFESSRELRQLVEDGDWVQVFDVVHVEVDEGL